MKMVYVNGSPKAKDSASEYLLSAVSQRLGQEHQGVHIQANKDQEKNVELWQNCDIIIVAFPLYVDAIPAHFLKWMMEMESIFRNLTNPPKLYVIVNCGFFEPKQNHLAVAVLKNWCKKCGLLWGMAMALGAGPMIRQAPIGKGPNKSLGVALEQLVATIKKKGSESDLYVKPNFPRFAYILMGNMGWNTMAKKNGVHRKEIYKRMS